MIAHFGNQTMMRIGKIAQLAGVATSRIRYYERIRLLPPPDRVSGQRRYDDVVLRRLAVIDVAKRAGMTLDEIRTLIEHGNAPMGDVLRDLSEPKLPAIDALIARAETCPLVAYRRPELRMPDGRRLRPV